MTPSPIVSVTFSPAFVALQREAAIAAEMLASGVTLLGKTTGSSIGRFGQALFNLSIGLERLGKLIFVVKHCNDTNGTFPNDQLLKDSFGHSIKKLMDYAATLAPQYLANDEYGSVPSSDVHKGIIASLTEFAAKTRYYNLNVLASGSSTPQDPVKTWFKNVCKPILDFYYSPEQRAAHAAFAQRLGRLIQPHMMVIQTGEDGEPIRTVEQALANAQVAKVIQKYSQLYVMQIVRHLSRLLWELESEAHSKRLEDVPFLHEYFAIFGNPDKYFKSRKTWSIYYR